MQPTSNKKVFVKLYKILNYFQIILYIYIDTKLTKLFVYCYTVTFHAHAHLFRTHPPTLN